MGLHEPLLGAHRAAQPDNQPSTEGREPAVFRQGVALEDRRPHPAGGKKLYTVKGQRCLQRKKRRKFCYSPVLHYLRL